ncbi:MAG: FecR domain-containing protein [Tannerella sp.]|jgi:ferric-dicitrate binding protein FerR (iron transport regulator)|nr:FecR domain-containing protein [Tannerella sp.]
MDKDILHFYEEERTVSERLELLRRAQSDKPLRDELLRHQQMRALAALAPRANDRKTAQEAWRRFMLLQKRLVILRRLRTALRHVAVAACIAGLTWLAAGRYFAEQSPEAADLQTLHVPAGQRICLTLQDGTVVWLNAQSRLTYPATFDADERHVAVEGEAWFEVAKDGKRPFVVTSGELAIRVLGTKFNVHRYPHETWGCVSLLEGALEVSTPGQSTPLRLRAGQEATLRDGKMTAAAIRNADHFLWKDGIYSFENVTLEEIMKALELYYDTAIEVKDPAMLRWKYTVKFRQRDGLHEILRLMQRIHRFTVKIDEEQNRITINR